MEGREIKFRGRKQDGKWIYGNLIIIGNDAWIARTIDNLGIAYEKVVLETIGQYTGLKDKNGKEIYEGDIVKEKIIYNENKMVEYVSLVDWDEVNPSMLLRRINSKYNNEYDFVKCGMTELEVVGNKWDNPELLGRYCNV